MSPIKSFSQWVLIALFIFIISCETNDDQVLTDNGTAEETLVIFHVNDQHGRLENFAKIKHIVDSEKKINDVLLVSAGDIFSGNPVVDNYSDKGYPIIDVMNQTGFDVTVIGNHEFDYGEATLNDRINQSNFDWICANADMSNSVINQPPAYATMSIGNLNVTFLGLVETNGSDIKTIPSSHPKKMENVVFERPENVVNEYQDLKNNEGSDLYIALTHIGHNYSDPNLLGDFDLATNYPFFDLIIGGHSNQLLDTVINNIPVFMAGYNLSHLGKITINFKGSEITNINGELINLDEYSNYDADLSNTIEAFNQTFPDLDDVIGYSEIDHYRWSNVGCFYTDALRNQLNVDICIQNSGGIRDNLYQGDITKREIYAIDPFNNGTSIYTMTVAEIKNFIKGSGMGLYYSGVIMEILNGDLIIKDVNENILDDNITLTLGINDYIPAVEENYFTTSPAIQPLTTAETIIKYMENNSVVVNYPDCERYIRY